MKRRIFIAIVFVSIGFNGCKKEQAQIPSFIRINGITLIDTDFVVARNGLKTSNNLTDDWVDMNGDYIGTFQNPTRFPVLYWGKVQGQFTPGVKADGTAATREIYPFIHPYATTLNLTAGQVTNLTPVYHYWSNTVAPVNEFFEDSINSFETIDTPGYAQYTIVHDTAEVFSGKGSLYLQLTSTNSQFELYARNAVLLPLDQPVWLEVNFKVDMPTTVGVIEFVPNGSGGTIQNAVYLVDMQPTSVWKKIYIDFTSTISTNVAGTTFTFIVVGTLPSGQQTGNIYLDNLRVLTFPDK